METFSVLNISSATLTALQNERTTLEKVVLPSEMEERYRNNTSWCNTVHASSCTWRSSGCSLPPSDTANVYVLT